MSSPLEDVILEGIDLAAILDDVLAFTSRFVAYPDAHAAIAHVLWIAHMHCMDAFESTPRLAPLSPEPASGKTRALEVTELLVPRPVEAVNVTPAYLFRKVGDAAGRPTILYDEIDTVFGPKAKEHEEIRGLLNAGHRKGAVAGRCVVRGKLVDTEEIPAFCAVALAGLGGLPETLFSRSIVIRMKRRSPNEHIEPFRRRLYQDEGHALRDRLGEWGLAATGVLQDSEPEMPETVVDRKADVWEGLIAIADMAGGRWPEAVRVAAVADVAAAIGSTPSLGIRLLGDLRYVFGDAGAMSTADTLTALHELDESPWADLKGKPLDARGLAWRLKEYDIKSTNIRDDGSILKGYKREDCHDAWERYLSPSPKESATSATDEEELEADEPPAAPTNGKSGTVPPRGSVIDYYRDRMKNGRPAVPCPTCGINQWSFRVGPGWVCDVCRPHTVKLDGGTDVTHAEAAQ